MKGYDSINRYCGRLEAALENYEEKESIVAEIRAHLEEETEAFIKEGCLPEVAELIAIDSMGPVPRLASGLKKYSIYNKPDMGEPYDFIAYKSIDYSPYSFLTKNQNMTKFRGAVRPFFVFLFMSSLWIFFEILALEGFISEVLKNVLVIAEIFLTTLFKCVLDSADSFTPIFKRKNVIKLALAAILPIVLFPLAKLLLFEYAFWMMLRLISGILVYPFWFYLIKFVNAAIFLGFSVKYTINDYENAAVPVLFAATVILPSIANFMSRAMLLSYYCIMLAFIIAALLYITFRCRSKYYNRMITAFFG
ncbi:MAG: hypothetical protein IJL89_02675, partial [Firmicutes bacterium]|nr:hypothetical protein [Bacillota bacterium]